MAIPAANTIDAATACIHTGVACRHHGTSAMAAVTADTGAGGADITGSASDADSEKPSSVCGGDQTDSASRVSPSAASSDVHAAHTCTCAAIAASSSGLPSLYR